MRVRYLIILVVLVLGPISAASPAQAGGVVAVCDEAHLLAAQAGDVISVQTPGGGGWGEVRIGLIS